MFFQRLHYGSYGGSLLADGYINTLNILALLIDYRIYSDSRLTCLTVTDYQLSLSPADRHHGVDSLDTGLQRGIH